MFWKAHANIVNTEYANIREYANICVYSNSRFFEYQMVFEREYSQTRIPYYSRQIPEYANIRDTSNLRNHWADFAEILHEVTDGQYL